MADCCVISILIHVTVCDCHAELKGYYYYYYYYYYYPSRCRQPQLEFFFLHHVTSILHLLALFDVYDSVILFIVHDISTSELT